MRNFILLFLCYTALNITAQVLPAPGVELNYNQIMFEHPAVPGASGYVIQIAADGFFNTAIAEVKDSFNATVISNLAFGKSYVWRYCSVRQGKRSAWSAPVQFNILADPYGVNQKIRMRVVQNDSANAGGIILVDEFHCIFDRHGQLVWFMPVIDTGFRKAAETFDMNVTRAGTVTVLTAENGLELNLQGQMLWMTPFAVNDTVLSPFGTFYNHDFKRLPNNNYMAIGRQLVWEKIPEDYDIYKIPYYLDTATWHPVLMYDGKVAYTMTAGFFLRKNGDGIYLLMNLANLVEFDKHDSIVWHWDAKDYLKSEDFLPKGVNLLASIRDQEPRMNGFCVDAQNKFVYVSFRNLDRIIKIDKSTGKVVYSWGSKMLSGEAMDGKDFFHKQHAPLVMNNGNLGVFNNADMDVRKEPSSVVVFSQPVAGKPSQVLWKFNCTFDSVMMRNKSSRAGNVDLLPNKNLMVCMGGINRVFEVMPDKKVVWSALLEKKSTSDSNWVPRPVYRAHYAASLYPCYYTIETNRDSLSSKETGFELSINNVGDASDSYNVTVTSSSNHYHYTTHTGNIETKQRRLIKIIPVKKPVSGERVEVLVKSDNNPDFERRLTLRYR